MPYSLIEKKRIRKDFGKLSSPMELPDLLKIQSDSYEGFLQSHKKPNERKLIGLHGVLKSIFPIVSQSGNAELSYESYSIGEPHFDAEECTTQGATYAASLYMKARLSLYEVTKTARADKDKKRKLKEFREEEVYLCEIPLMTEKRSFIIKGIERVVVSQLHRSPGVFFVHDKGKAAGSGGKPLYSVQIIPDRGSWLCFEFDTKDLLYARIDKKRKMPATTLLRAIGLTDQEILAKFFDTNRFTVRKNGVFSLHVNPNNLLGQELAVDIKDASGKVLVKANTRINRSYVRQLEKVKVGPIALPIDKFPKDWVLAKDIVDQSTGEVLISSNTVIDHPLLERIIDKGVKSFQTLVANDLDRGAYIAKTLRADSTKSKESALALIYSILRPGEPATPDAKEKVFQNLFFTDARYDLSEVGRMKFNLRVGRKSSEGELVLTYEDILDVLKTLVAVRDGRDEIDQIDHLGNRRVRSVGEAIANQFRIGLIRVERVVKERLGVAESEGSTPKSLVNSKPVSAAIKEFFGSSQLSQFADQANPLAEVTHKRRVSALGPGGLNRDRAGFEVRDVNSTHYGRICPIETPEGPNIGLINSLAIYAQTDRYGFLQTPYRKVKNSKPTNEIEYLSAIDEKGHVIAQADATLDAKGHFADQMVEVRYQNEYVKKPSDSIDYMDVSPQQVISVSSALIPFLEHDDANRALMGSNMQRQSVPTLRAEKPLVGTGMEQAVARDSGSCQLARRDGVVASVDSNRVVVRVGDEATDVDVDIYNLKKYTKSNQSTCMNQRPLVQEGEIVKRGDVLIDGASIDLGELALGQNVRVAFMCWSGYNYEDAILISERLVRENCFTSIHIQEHTCTARETKLGTEEITKDIPNVTEHALSKLDDSGIVYVGAKVEPGDILVGKVTPKGETQLTPEERLLLAVFGDKASDVKDTSLRVPASASGTVIDVQILTRSGVEQDQRSKEIKQAELKQTERDLQTEYSVFETTICDHLRKQLAGQTAATKSRLFEPGTVLSKEQLKDLTNTQLFQCLVNDKKVNGLIARCEKDLRQRRQQGKEKLKRKEEKLSIGAELTPDVQKIVKVFLAVKRPIQPGDKMAGRHGNKGVISTIVPVEDMPFDANGEPVDVVLNPLGVPSRMNIGQILETHLGWAAKELGKQIAGHLEAYQLERETIQPLRDHLKCVYQGMRKDGNDVSEDLDKFSDREICELAGNLAEGVPMATRSFDGASEKEIKDLLSLANLPTDGQTILYDGRTGDPFERPVTIGYMYMLKLNHLVDDKMHARATGSYSLVTQQPLGGKSNFGGQRLGEMEVWALEAYGAAYTLQEMLTVKSDDVSGRTKTYKNLVNNNYEMEAKSPEVFNVLIQEIRSMGMNLEKLSD